MGGDGRGGAGEGVCVCVCLSQAGLQDFLFLYWHIECRILPENHGRHLDIRMKYTLRGKY